MEPPGLAGLTPPAWAPGEATRVVIAANEAVGKAAPLLADITNKVLAPAQVALGDAQGLVQSIGNAVQTPARETLAASSSLAGMIGSVASDFAIRRGLSPPPDMRSPPIVGTTSFVPSPNPFAPLPATRPGPSPIDTPAAPPIGTAPDLGGPYVIWCSASLLQGPEIVSIHDTTLQAGLTLSGYRPSAVGEFATAAQAAAYLTVNGDPCKPGVAPPRPPIIPPTPPIALPPIGTPSPTTSADPCATSTGLPAGVSVFGIGYTMPGGIVQVPADWPGLAFNVYQDADTGQIKNEGPFVPGAPGQIPWPAPWRFWGRVICCNRCPDGSSENSSDGWPGCLTNCNLTGEPSPLDGCKAGWAVWKPLSSTCYCRKVGEAPDNPSDTLVAVAATEDDCKKLVAFFCLGTGDDCAPYTPEAWMMSGCSKDWKTEYAAFMPDQWKQLDTVGSSDDITAWVVGAIGDTGASSSAPPSSSADASSGPDEESREHADFPTWEFAL